MATEVPQGWTHDGTSGTLTGTGWTLETSGTATAARQEDDMTGTIDAHPVPDGAEPQRGLAGSRSTTTPPGAVLEQAKGVLIFRYGIGADAALGLIELWAAERDATVDAVAQAVVRDICEGDRSQPSDPALVRWLEDRLRHELPTG